MQRTAGARSRRTTVRTGGCGRRGVLASACCIAAAGALASGLIVATAASASGACGSSGVYSVSGATQTCTYASAGTEDTFSVPAGVSNLDVVAIGATGGSGENGASGGLGAQVTNSALPVTAPSTLYVDVGSAGATGSCSAGVPGGAFDGGSGSGNVDDCYSGGGGGGSSAVLTVPRATAVSDGLLTGVAATDARLLVAGGGAGGGGFESYLEGANAGSAPPIFGSGGVDALDAGGGGGGGWVLGQGGNRGFGGGGGSSYGGAGLSAGITTAIVSSTQAPEVTVSWITPVKLTAPAVNREPQWISLPTTLTDGTGRPIAGATLVFSVGSQVECVLKTFANGYQTCPVYLSAAQVRSATSYTISYGGSPTHPPVTVTGVLYYRAPPFFNPFF